MQKLFPAFLLFLIGTLVCLPGCNTASSVPTEFDLAIEAVKEGKTTKIVTKDMPSVAEVGDDDIKKLEGLEGLKELRLNKSAITGECLHSIMLIPNLEILSLGETRVKDDDLAIITKHPKLRHLSLDETRVTDKGLAHVVTIPNLQELFLWRDAITDEGCTTIAKMTKLTRLGMDETRISGTGFKKLQTLKNLKIISVWRTAVTEEDAVAFNKTLPDCKVNR